MPNSVNATMARILYVSSRTYVGMSSRIDAPTMSDPQISGLRGPNRCSSFSPTLMNATIAIVAFIRVGEKLLQRFGPRKPLIWGSLIVGASILLLMPTYVLLDTYKILAIVAFTLFGIGLAFYATPSTDAALANLPDNQAGSGSGIYKMASSLGASFGVAISAAIFTALSADNSTVDWIAGLITFVGRQDNLAIRQAALFAFGANLLMVVAALISIMLTVPSGRTHEIE